MAKRKNVEIVLNPKDAKRFWAKVDLIADDGESCWNWHANTGSNGYGKFKLNGMDIAAHRVSWVICRGPIPNLGGSHGTCVRHACDNPRCCRPDHLSIGSHSDNMSDMVQRGRSNTGERNPRARLTASDVVKIREMHASGRFTLRRLADMFGVHLATIGYAVNGKTWKHLPQPTTPTTNGVNACHQR